MNMHSLDTDLWNPVTTMLLVKMKILHLGLAEM